MLSIENPSVDPAHPKSSSDDNKGSSSDNQQQLQQVDLLKSDLDDNNNNPIPKFTLRDYVFNSRSKDIRNNWPFSQESLELCLKHGVADLLPPFESPDIVRNPPLESCTNDSLLSEKENISYSNGEPQSDRVFVDSKNAGCSPKLAEDCSNTNPSGSEGDKAFPSTITSQSCPEIDSVDPTNKSASLESEADILPELSVAKPEVISSASNKTENITQVPVKKCRLVVKLSSIANSSTKEDTAVNNFMISEGMASKVCPVCKTFTSSSNTTLNAHIDQCLSGESTAKWTTNSKVIKHRIKPRKIKSMVEIYATAPYCTLEELDRRNGTNWATNSILPAQEIETSADQKKEGLSPASLEETPDEGAVYIDANGTKVRILSKSNDPSVLPKVVDDSRAKKFINSDKVSKVLSAKRKKQQNQVQKQHKLLKHSKRICSPRPYHPSQTKNNQDRNFSEEESLEKEDCMTQQIRTQTEVKFSRPDMIRGWACSKRTGLTKKSNGRSDHQHSGSRDNMDCPVENNQLSLGDSHVIKSSARRMSNIFENPLSSPGSSRRIDIPSHGHHDEYREQPSLRKRPGLSSVESQASHDRKRSQVLLGYPDHNVKRMRSNEHHSQVDHVSLLSKRNVKMNAGVDSNADGLVGDPKLSANHQNFISKARRFSSLRKKLSAGRRSLPDSRFNSNGKCSQFKKSRVQSVSESNEEAVGAVDQLYVSQNTGEVGGRIEGTCDIESLEGTGVLNIRKSVGGGSMVSRKEESVALKSSHSVSVSYHHDAGGHNGSFELGPTAGRSGVAQSAGKDIHDTCVENLDSEPPSEVATDRAFTDFRNSMDAGFHGLAGSSDAHSDSQGFIEVHKEQPIFEAEAPTSSAEPILSGGQEMFCAAEVPENMTGENVHVMAELDSSDGHGNYFAEVDPIPIPGPPGSFLPSPGHMDLEDLQGNSSLTSSRVQSSDDHQELVDHSSGSPVSATSTISNSTLARSDSKSSGKSSVGHPPFPDEMRSGSFSAANGDPPVENSSPALLPTDAGREKISLNELKVNSNITEKGAFRSKSDLPCCCLRKEGLAQNVYLNYQESQLIRRRTMAADIVPASGEEMTGDIEKRLDGLRSEMSSVGGQSPRSEIATKSPMGPITSRISADSEIKFPDSDDRDSCSPSASNPVLRLMGKNLMVVKKDEDISPQLKPSQLTFTVGNTNSQGVPLYGVSAGNAQNDNQHIGQHVVSQGPFCFDQTESRKRVIQHHEMRWSDGFGSNGNSGTPQLSPLASPAILSSRGAVRGFMGSSMHHDYMARYHLPSEQHQPIHILEPSITCDAGKFVKSPSLKWRNANTTENAVKEIIVIDDTPENEVDLTTVATHDEGMVPGMGYSSSSGKSIAAASPCDSQHLSTFRSYQQYESATFTGSPVNASFWMPPPGRVNGGSSVNWNRTPEGSNTMHASPLVITSSSTAQQRSKLYTSSNF
ncbi:hypothetical protein ACH5RR_038149 [Cinchona calisaya]|uniref:Uncharacterized protein n=1 Tax=Cinchona calisaya TaxID=153742 RepID=A0ABD2YBW5_9GENT